VTTRSDIERLPDSQWIVDARVLSDADIPALERLHGLKDIDFFAGCGGPASITDQGLESLAKLKLPHLETLSLGLCGNITDSGLAYIANLRSVTQLILAGCMQVTDSGLPELLRMKHLHYLDLRGCPGISDRGLQVLAAKPSLTWIVLDGCPNVTAAGVARLKAALPNARIQKDDAAWADMMRGIDPKAYAPEQKT
jgi:hypothetical protein